MNKDTILEHATMKDVAREAGVSIGTVDRVLHNRGRVADETACRVHTAAKKLSFRPNLVARNLKRGKWRTLVAILPYPQQDCGYWRQVVNGIDRAIREVAPHYVRVEFAFYDRFQPDSFRRQAKAIIAACRQSVESKRSNRRTNSPAPYENLSGIILAPTLQSASADLVQNCSPIPVVVIDGELPNVRLLSSISQESYESGLLGGKLLHLMAGSGRQVSVVVGRDDYHLLHRRAGFEDYFRRIATTERLEASSEQELVEIVSRRVSNGPAIDGIFVTNAAAHTVIDSMDASYRPAIVGYDLIPENVARLKDGTLGFIINQHPDNQGYQAVYALYRHTTIHEPVEAHIRIPVDLVTWETLRFHQVSESPADN